MATEKRLDCKNCVHFLVCRQCANKPYFCNRYMKYENTVEVVRCKDCKNWEDGYSDTAQKFTQQWTITHSVPTEKGKTMREVFEEAYGAFWEGMRNISDLFFLIGQAVIWFTVPFWAIPYAIIKKLKGKDNA